MRISKGIVVNEYKPSDFLKVLLTFNKKRPHWYFSPHSISLELGTDRNTGGAVTSAMALDIYVYQEVVEKVVIFNSNPELDEKYDARSARIGYRIVQSKLSNIEGILQQG